MNTANNKTIVERLADAHNRQDLKQLRELLAPDFKAHLTGMDQPIDRESYLEGVKMAHQSFSELIFTIQDIIAEGEKVVARILAQGKHTGEYMGIRPTGNLVKFDGIIIRRIVDDKVIEEWQTGDHLSLLRQLGGLDKGL